MTKIKFFTDPRWTKYIKTMLRRQAYRFELRPSGQQLRNLRQFAGSCRFVYNQVSARNTARYNKKRLGYAGLCALLPNWKREHPFLSEVPAQALRQALKDLERAYTNFFLKRSEFPKFKKKGQRESFRVPQGFEVDNGIGLDWGVVRLYTRSNGAYREQCQPLKRFLPKWQRRMTQKRKFSRNWKKARTGIAKLRQRIANIRKEFRSSNEISKNHAVVFVEDLPVSNMCKSCKGSRTCPVAWGGCGQVSADNRKTQAKLVCSEMRAVSQCGFHQCGKYPLGGTRLASLCRTFACSKCVVAGTHRRYP